jgi:hypothetical protein
MTLPVRVKHRLAAVTALAALLLLAFPSPAFAACTVSYQEGGATMSGCGSSAANIGASFAALALVSAVGAIAAQITGSLPSSALPTGEAATVTTDETYQALAAAPEAPAAFAPAPAPPPGPAVTVDPYGRSHDANGQYLPTAAQAGELKDKPIKQERPGSATLLRMPFDRTTAAAKLHDQAVKEYNRIDARRDKAWDSVLKVAPVATVRFDRTSFEGGLSGEHREALRDGVIREHPDWNREQIRDRMNALERRINAFTATTTPLTNAADRLGTAAGFVVAETLSATLSDRIPPLTALPRSAGRIPLGMAGEFDDLYLANREALLRRIEELKAQRSEKETTEKTTEEKATEEKAGGSTEGAGTGTPKDEYDVAVVGENKGGRSGTTGTRKVEVRPGVWIKAWQGTRIYIKAIYALDRWVKAFLATNDALRALVEALIGGDHTMFLKIHARPDGTIDIIEYDLSGTHIAPVENEAPEQEQEL